jgi:protein disulfide-isomerase A6
LKGKASSSSSSGSQGSHGGSGSQGSHGGSGSGSGSGSASDVVILTDSNFDDLVINSQDAWMVEFYAPWCGHCQRLEPEWNSAATKLKGEVKVGKVDSTVEQGITSRFGVNGYPTIKFFPPGGKSDSSAESYEGARDASTITDWAVERKNALKPLAKVEQMVSQEGFDEACANHKGTISKVH